MLRLYINTRRDCKVKLAHKQYHNEIKYLERENKITTTSPKRVIISKSSSHNSLKQSNQQTIHSRDINHMYDKHQSLICRCSIIRTMVGFFTDIVEYCIVRRVTKWNYNQTSYHRTELCFLQFCGRICETTNCLYECEIKSQKST